MQRCLFWFWTTVLVLGIIGQLGSCTNLAVTNSNSEAWGPRFGLVLSALIWLGSALATLLAAFLFSFEKLSRKALLWLWAGVLGIVPGICFLMIYAFKH
jgi:hypothetical protein